MYSVGSLGLNLKADDMAKVHTRKAGTNDMETPPLEIFIWGLGCIKTHETAHGSLFLLPMILYLVEDLRLRGFL